MHQVPDQLQVGIKNRNAGRDYNDHSIYVPNFKYWQLTASRRERDKLAIENETYFKFRFKYDAPFQQRKHTISLKRKLDLTDLEIINLKKSGLLTLCKGQPTALSAERSAFGIGIFYLLIAAFLFGLLTTSAGRVSTTAQLLGFSGVTVMFFTLLWLSFRISFHPLHILKKRGISLGQKWFLNDNS